MRTTELPQAAMSAAIEPTRRQQTGRRNPAMVLVFVLLWLVLIAGGVTGAKLYSEHIQSEVAANLSAQTASQIQSMQRDYDARITKLEEEYKAQLALVESKIQSLNELLEFTKDNADAKTDNSNKLYSQLADVKKQLAELKKSLDVLR